MHSMSGRYSDMQPPYILSVSGYHNSYELTNVGTTQTNRMEWHVNFPAGTRLWFQLVDSNQTDIYTNIVTVAPSGDASCVNVTNPLVTDPATSTILGSATSSRSAAAENTATDTPNQTSDSRSPVVPIAGGIAGVVVALLILLLCLLWFKRGSKRSLAALHAQDGLDLSEGAYVAEPFMIQAASSAGRVGHTSKMRSTASNLTAPHLDYSSSGVSVPITINAAPNSSMKSIQSDSPITRVSWGPAAEGRERYNGAVQEQDAGVSLSEGLQPNGHATLPPAYDSSWRT
ncbi:putative transmembrane protein [Rhizoctonia solani 123E]|uniref:Putative transmembrane protein n=1 Tax=Rhizoctonia solani 123E TaxID=1423351 RepID=A0A074S406_9AGAM|nr:putative transmembrane protein [Rhizoctonia solani 123E]